MELLVQKASLSLFLKEQRTLLFERIKEEIRGNDELLLDLEKLGSIDRKLQALEVEIESDPNVDLLRRVIAEASGFAPSEKFANFPPFTRLLLQTVDQVGRIMFAIR